MNQEVDIQRGAEQLLGQALYFLLSGSIAAAGARPRFVGLANRSTSQHRVSVGQVLGGSISAAPVKARPKPARQNIKLPARMLPLVPDGLAACHGPVTLDTARTPHSLAAVRLTAMCGWLRLAAHGQPLKPEGTRSPADQLREGPLDEGLLQDGGDLGSSNCLTRPTCLHAMPAPQPIA